MVMGALMVDGSGMWGHEDEQGTNGLFFIFFAF